MPIHPVAEAFAGAVEDYERGRPEYPREAVVHLARTLRLNSASRVLELGAGSGKFTRSLLREGIVPMALEPVGPMRASLHRSVGTVPVLAATAEALPLRNTTIDAVLAAQSFHWFRADPTMRELARVLRPGGGIGLVWNVRDEEVPWVKRFGDIVRSRESPGAPHFRGGQWKSAFEERPETFTPVRSETFRQQHLLDRDGVVARALSISYIAALPPEERARVEREIRDLLDQAPELRGQERIPFPYRTEAYSSFRR